VKACIGIPPLDDYPYHAVIAGLSRLGYTCEPATVKHEADILAVWSPWMGSYRQQLQILFAAAEKPVIVMENGWLSPMAHRPYYQIALDGWNGTGTFPAGGAERWASFGVHESPWKIGGAYELVIGQRGHPKDQRTAPPDWHMGLGFPADRQIVRRPRVTTRPLAADLAGASVCHVWSSNAASHAVVAGVPVIQHGPNLMVSAMASKPGDPIFRGERQPELIRLAWAQWNLDEIRSGEPFARLLRR